MQLVRKAEEFLQRLEDRVNDPGYILKHKGKDEYLLALSKSKETVPRHWISAAKAKRNVFLYEVKHDKA